MNLMQYVVVTTYNFVNYLFIIQFINNIYINILSNYVKFLRIFSFYIFSSYILIVTFLVSTYVNCY